MFVLLHVVMALSSVVYSGYVFFSPSRSKLRLSYSLVILTLASGTYLVVSRHAAMLQACMTGLVFTGVCLIGIISARHKLLNTEAYDDGQD